MQHIQQEDSYGCVQYLPGLSGSETPQIQEEKKNKLLQDYHRNLISYEDIEQLMKDTYPTQRINIVKRGEEKLINILNMHWPHLQRPLLFFDHASTLFRIK